MSAAIPILFADEHLVVAHKPAGLLSVPLPGTAGRDLPQVLRKQGLEVLAVHRLDREVSGAVLLARDERTRAALEELFRARALRKLYWALARGQVRPPSGEIKFPILDEGNYARVSAKGKPSLTRYRTLASYPLASALEVDLVTGRYNQIRLHLAHLGFPLVGERKYARGNDDPFRFRRAALHAWKLALRHPWTGDALEVEAPLPAELVELEHSARAAS